MRNSPQKPDAHRPRGPMMGGFAMGDPTAQIRDFRASGRQLLAALRPERLRITTVILLATIGATLSVIGPKILGDATNIVFAGVVGQRIPAGVTKAQAVAQLRTQGETRMANMLTKVDFVPGQGIAWDQLGRILLLLVAIYLLSTFAMFAASFIVRTIVHNTGYRFRAQLQAKIDRLSLSYLDKHPRGDLLSRATNDIDNIVQTLQQTLMQAITSILQVVGIAGVMLWISWRLALVMLLVLPIGAFITRTVMGRAKPWFTKRWRATGSVSAVVEEAFTGHEVVTTYGLAPQFAAEFDTENDELYQASFRAEFFSGTLLPLMTVITNLAYVIIAVLGGVWITAGTISLGGVQAFVQYSRQFTQPIGQLASVANLIQSAVASAERIFDLLEAPEMGPDTRPESEQVSSPELTQPLSPAASPAASGATPTPQPTSGAKGIVFDRVRFGYDPDKPVLHNVNLQVAPGQTVAIVGPTGAGKTTLVNLLMRFYEVDAGAIYLDGTDIRDIPRAELRRRIGMVLQDTWLFGGSIADNIAFGRTGATRAEVEAAAEATCVAHLIATLPAGYDTVIDEDGGGISAGERQLITIARAFLADPQILVLDEATSSVDTRTEVAVRQGMAELRQGRTGFVIAHRLSTIRDADLIIVVEEGDVVEQGAHDQLLARDGAYARLYRAQFAAPKS